jgi:CDP-diacylglycerol--serine O-phosphatidyltransferase
MAARIVLLAAIADGLDGILARRYGGSPYGSYFDGLSDALSFGVAPAVIVWMASGSGAPDATTLLLGGALGLYLAMALTRLAVYTAEDASVSYTTGVPTTLAATLIVLAVIGGLTHPLDFVGVGGVLALLMVSEIRYPDLRVRDALGMGVLQAGVVIAPTAFGLALPVLLAGCATAYLLFAPYAYRKGRPESSGTSDTQAS